jgi:glycosyltransferase involved in cell wall biosynthesis
VTSGREAIRWLDGQPVRPSVVVVYGGGASYALRNFLWGRRRGCPVVADVVEWYAPRQFRGGVASPSYLSAHLALRLVYPRFDGAIAISRYVSRRLAPLDNVVIPPTLRVEPMVSGTAHFGDDPASGDHLTLCYFGNPGRKDLLPEIIDAFASVPSRTPEGTHVRLLIAGPDEAEVLRLRAGPLPDGVAVLGRIQQQQVRDLLASVDFSILLRPDATYSRAGFPTKFVESLANATPVIGNLTSDLQSYLIDGETGLVVPSATAVSLAETISRAVELSRTDKVRMRVAAVHMARSAFDPAVYVDAIHAFLSGLEGSKGSGHRGASARRT